MNVSLTSRQKFLIGVFLFLSIVFLGVYLTYEPEYKYDQAESEDITTYSWTSEVTVERNASYLDQPETNNSTVRGYLDYESEQIYAVKTISENDKIYYTTEELSSFLEPEEEEDLHYRKIFFDDIKRWDVGQIPQERAEKMNQINSSTTEYVFKIERLSVSRDFVRNITSPTDIDEQTIDKLTRRNWDTSGEISVRIKDYGDAKRVKQIEYTLEGKPLEGDETITVHYKVTFDYSTNEPPEDIIEHFQ